MGKFAYYRNEAGVKQVPYNATTVCCKSTKLCTTSIKFMLLVCCIKRGFRDVA